MSYQVLALKWRPKRFEDAVGQEAIVKTLKNSLIQKKIGHAYLLTGTRGIGKTTFARIFAKAIRCENLREDGEPCLTCNSCQSIENSQSLDFIEIDGASNNSVDDVRDLIENVQYLPTTGDYKVYIIDEVHMLSVNAFNALLKTLEEPPKHVVFIFATTDPQKLLGTVLSRCLRFDFKNASEEELSNHLAKIAKSEEINVESEQVFKELAKQARGSFRDALSLFDQVISLSQGNNINEDSLYLSLGMANSKTINEMVEALIQKDKTTVQDIYNKVTLDNIDFKNFSIQVLDRIYDLINSISGHQVENTFGVKAEVLSSVGLIELMWIYESMYKDFEWSFKSIEPQQATQFVFIKATLRELVLQKQNTALEVKKKDNLIQEEAPEPVVEAAPIGPQPSEQAHVEVEKTVEASVETTQIVEPVVETAQEEVEHTWENFMSFLFAANRAIAVNLEHGNLINKEDFGFQECVYEIGFSADSKIFYDYLIELDNSYKLKESLCAFLGFDTSQIEVNLKLIDDAEKEETNFLSNAQIVVQNKIEEEEQQRDKLLNNKYIKNAQELFNAEVKKVVLNKE